LIREDDDGKPVPLLHKKLHISRPKDEITTWCYPLRKRVTYAYSHVRRYKEPAFTLKQVMAMFGRTSRTPIEMAIINGDIPAPQYAYTLDEVERNTGYYFHERDILALHKLFSQIHYGRPRKDGLITPYPGLPNERELKAMIRQEQIFYVKDGDKFVPTWRAPDI
jgi:hypothetical protein